MKRLAVILITLALVSSMCITNSNEKRENMKNAKVLMVIAPKDFRDEELFEPMAVFESNGLKVDVVSTTKGECVGMLGNKITVEKPYMM